MAYSASTITLQDSIYFAQTFGGFKSLNVGGNNEPAITCANIVKCAMLGAPFKWPWNRATTSFLTTPGLQDYQVTNLAAFGFIEKAGYTLGARVTSVTSAGGTVTYVAANSFTAGATVNVTGAISSNNNITGVTMASVSASQFTVLGSGTTESEATVTAVAVSGGLSEISNISQVLGVDTSIGAPPNFIAEQLDDGAGDITFRILPAANKYYQVTPIFQQRVSTLFAALTDKWTPIPDFMSHVFQAGFLALMMGYWGDIRWQQWNQKFVGGLLGAAEGLSEEDKNVFLLSWSDSMNTAQLVGSTRRQQGVQGLGT